MAFYLNVNYITGVSQKQKCAALSSREYEFKEVTATTCQGIWLYKFLRKITDIKAGWCSTLTINLRKTWRRLVFHGRSKHIDICYHFIRDCVERGEIVLKHVNTNEQRANVLTKALSIVKFEGKREVLGVKNPQPSLD